jgi:predicted NAD/FAD-dependent oxidoreductase
MAMVDLAIIGAGVSGCALASQLRRLGWQGSLQLLEIGRGPGGRAATRRSRHDAAWRLDHGAPLFNISAASPPALLEPLLQAGWIEPWSGAIHRLEGDGRIAAAELSSDPFSSGALYRGVAGMDQLCRGLLALAEAAPLQSNCLVRRLQALPEGGWRLLGGDGSPLLDCRWLVLSGTLLAHPRCQTVFGWPEVPLQQAAEPLADPQLQQALAVLAAIGSQASSNLLLNLPADVAADAAAAWLAQPYRLLQCSPAAQARWGLRRLSIQPLAAGGCGVVAESSSDFAAAVIGVHGSRSAAAQWLGAHADPQAEQAVMEALAGAIEQALGLPTAPGDRQLMRWGAAFPEPPGLPEELSLCPDSRIGFCGDAIAGPGFGRIEGALRSAEALAERLLVQL